MKEETSSKKKYFHIELKNLPNDTIIFPFHIYITTREKESYSVYLHANSPLSEDKRKTLEQYIAKGALLGISIGQKRTFLQDTRLKEEDITDLRERRKHDLEIIRDNRIREIENKAEEDVHQKFYLKKELAEALERDDFSNLIHKARNDVLLFNVTVSPSVSLSIDLCQKLLTQDNPTNRIVALSYWLAVLSKVEKEEELGELICAAFLHHLGLTQLPRKFSLTPFQIFSEEEKVQFKKHVGLTTHVIRKSGLELGERCLKIISQHHERTDGSGYPQALKREHIDPLSLVLGAASHFVEYSEGKITGKKMAMKTILGQLKTKTRPSGLESGFGDKVMGSLINF